MKKPRVSDFDPNAKSPELKSSMEAMPAIEKPLSVNGEAKIDPVPRYRGTTVPAARRMMRRRHPFDIYEDQYEALRQLSLEDRKRGGLGSMSEMAREAIDAYLKKRPSES